MVLMMRDRWVSGWVRRVLFAEVSKMSSRWAKTPAPQSFGFFFRTKHGRSCRDSAPKSAIRHPFEPAKPSSHESSSSYIFLFESTRLSSFLHRSVPLFLTRSLARSLALSIVTSNYSINLHRRLTSEQDSYTHNTQLLRKTLCKQEVSLFSILILDQTVLAISTVQTRTSLSFTAYSLIH